MEAREDLNELMELFLSHRISAEQHARLVSLIRAPGSDAVLEDLLKHRFYGDDQGEDSIEEGFRYLETLKARMGDSMPVARGRVVRLRKWAAWAAAVLAIIAGSVYLLFRDADKATLPQSVRFKNDVGPGGNKAILTLADGSHIVLDSTRNGELGVQGTAMVYKKDGALFYQPAGNTRVVYNTVSTSIKGQYRLTLADGTKVWLDAMSSIRYPTAFSNDGREVEITGQVYFEVRADAMHPFRVKVNSEIIEALGTRFNINAYGDEPATRTTLAEGLVRILHDKDSFTLLPGQQYVSQAGENSYVTKDPDMEEVLAWKEGSFHFNGMDIEGIMRLAARWYGVKVVYRDKVRKQFVGDIPRDVPLARLLNLLELTHHVHFIIEGQTITVMK